jgi:hypothetical protein
MYHTHDFSSQLQNQLDGIQLSWRDISVEFGGNGLPDASSYDEWSELTTLGYRDVGPSTDTVKNCDDLAQAYHHIVCEIRTLILDRLTLWCAAAAPAVLDDQSFETIPVPLATALPPAAAIPDSILAELTGTPDLVAAGRRIIFWCAAYLHPVGYRRGMDHQVQFFAWTGKLVEGHGNNLWASRQVLEAIRAAWEVTRVTKENPAPSPTEVSDHLIRKGSKKRYTFRFRGEVGTISGEGAVRLCQMLRYRNCRTSELYDPRVGRAEHHRSLARQDQSESDATLVGGQSVRPNERQFRQGQTLRRVREELDDIELRIGETSSAEEREELTEQRDQIQRYLNADHREEPSLLQRERQAVRRSLDRLIDDLDEKTPLLAAHLRDSCQFVPETEEFVYAPKTDIHWQFDGF